MPSFSLATFNMQFGQMWDSDSPDGAPVDLSRTVEAIRGANADIFLLQEVEKAAGGAVQQEPPPNYQFLQKAFPEYDSTFLYPPLDERELPFGFGLAIFSRYPLGRVEATVLPAPPISFEFNDKMQEPAARVLLEADVTIEGRLVHIANAHLQAFFMLNRASSDDFPQQRSTVLNRMLQVEGPVVLGGDFNIAPLEGTLAQFAEAGVVTCQKEQNTWKRMDFVTDHIFYTEPLQLQDCQVLETAASDHDIVRSVFILD